MITSPETCYNWRATLELDIGIDVVYAGQVRGVPNRVVLDPRYIFY